MENTREIFSGAERGFGPQAVKLTGSEYRKIRKQVLAECGPGPEADFNIIFDLEEYALNVCGSVYRDECPWAGDGYFVPGATECQVVIRVDFYECRDREGHLVPCSLDPKELL